MGRTHRQFEELLAWVDAGCFPFLIGPAGSFKTSAAAKVAEALGRPFHMDSMSEGKTPFDLHGVQRRDRQTRSHRTAPSLGERRRVSVR